MPLGWTGASRVTTGTTPARLIALSISHYVEKARWALDVAGVPYVEERHVPLFHRVHTRRAGGTTVPLLVVDGRAYTDSEAIVAYADAQSHALLPLDPAGRSEALETMRWLDRELGPHARRWAYGELLGSASLLTRCFAAGAPMLERALAPLAVRAALPLIRRGFRVTPENAARSLARVDEAFRVIGDRLADGREWLVGATFGAADLTFAALAAPLLLPEQFGGAIPGLDEVPATMRATVQRFRALPAGRYALRAYSQHRRR